MQCNPSSDKTPINAAFGLAFEIVLFAPMCIVILTNILILYIVSRTTQDQNNRNPGRKAVVTISLVCWIFVLSYAPLLPLYFPGVTGGKLPGWYQLIASNTVTINLIVNPIIYTFTNKRFAGFMKGLVQGKITALMSLAGKGDARSSSQSGNVLNARSRSTGNIVIENADTV